MSIAVWSPSDLPNRSVQSYQARQSIPVFLVTTQIAAALLASIVVIPQFLSKQARWEVLRSHVAEIGRLAAGLVDGDLHRQLLYCGARCVTMGQPSVSSSASISSASVSIVR
jgi:hypothetical protein